VQPRVLRGPQQRVQHPADDAQRLPRRAHGKGAESGIPLRGAEGTAAHTCWREEFLQDTGLDAVVAEFKS
jgi:hypothetical protein